MRETDIRVTAAAVTFQEVRLDQPLSISGRAISWFTVAEVHLETINRIGSSGRGLGASSLSVPWAWPEAEASIETRDQILRELTEELAREAVGAGPADPIEIWRGLYGDLDSRLARSARRHGIAEIPRLAGLLALGAVDNAVHDGWAMAAGQPASTMYHADHLSADLGWLDPTLRGRYPGDFLVAPIRALAVQHVVGVTDPLTAADASTGVRPLTDWLHTDGVNHLKLKVRGLHPDQDARRVVEVARLGAEQMGEIHLAVDPNEGCADAAAAVELLEEIDRIDPDVSRRLDYLEQPVPRGSSANPAEMRPLAARLPVLLDEGFTDLSALPHLADLGWSGVVIKAAKGHSLALLTNAWANALHLWVAVQDLTAISWALVHSARLVSMLDLSARHLEYNSRQYAPAAADALAASLPQLARVRHGQVRLPARDAPGLYQLPTPIGAKSR